MTYVFADQQPITALKLAFVDPCRVDVDAVHALAVFDEALPVFDPKLAVLPRNTAMLETDAGRFIPAQHHGLRHDVAAPGLGRNVGDRQQHALRKTWTGSFARFRFPCSDRLGKLAEGSHRKKRAEVALPLPAHQSVQRLTDSRTNAAVSKRKNRSPPGTVADRARDGRCWIRIRIVTQPTQTNSCSGTGFLSSNRIGRLFESRMKPFGSIPRL